MAIIKEKTKNRNYSFLIPSLYTVVKSYQVFDVETDGLNPYHGDKVFAFCIGDYDYNVKVYRLDHNDEMLNKKNRKILQDFFTNTSIAKIAHNFKFELMMLLEAEGINVPEGTVWHDTMIMSQLLRNLAPSHALAYLGWELFGYDKSLDKEVARLGKMYGNYQRIPISLMTEYQKADGIRPMLLFKLFYPELKSNGKLYNDYINEIELVKTTYRLESFGIEISHKNINEILVWLNKEFRQVQENTKEYLNEYINLNSDMKLRALLFDRMGFPILKHTKTRKASTDKDVLLELKATYPNEKIFDLTIKWRSYSTGITTIGKYKRLADHNNIIHPNIKTNHAKTGRESSENPNMQNVSKKSALKNPYPIPARKCFVARKGRVLYFVDYKGIEMRLIIGLSNETILLGLLEQDFDPHHYFTECLFGESYVNNLKLNNYNEYKILRDGCKNGHFALGYGAGLPQIAVTVNAPIDRIQGGYNLYREKCPNIVGFTSETAKLFRKQKFIMTPFGRSLKVPWSEAYQAANYLVQGTAAGVIKRAQVRIDRYLKTVWDDEIRLVLPIHDEVIISVPDYLDIYREGILNDISYIMTHIDEIEVPLGVSWKRTITSWDAAKDFKLAA
jgi:DNA polymerase-1